MVAKALMSWLAFPVYVWQGIGVRLRTERMHPARGPVRNRIEGGDRHVRLLVLGDSSAASVGVGTTEQGLASIIAAMIAKRTGATVTWRAAGFNSATSGQIRDHVVPNLDAEQWTHIILAVGTNDAKNFHTAARFKREFGGLLYALRAKWPLARIVWSPVVDMRLVPALPGPLGRVLELRAGIVNRKGAALCAERDAVPATRLPILDATGFSTDGFHASEIGYRAWADHLYPFVMEETPDATR